MKGDDDGRAIAELSMKLQENSTRLKQVDAQRRQLENEIRRAAFTAAHLDELPDTVATYHSVGKAYLFKPKKAIMADLEEMVREQDSEIKKAKSTKENLMAAQESLIKELQELQK